MRGTFDNVLIKHLLTSNDQEIIPNLFGFRLFIVHFAAYPDHRERVFSQKTPINHHNREILEMRANRVVRVSQERWQLNARAAGNQDSKLPRDRSILVNAN